MDLDLKKKIYIYTVYIAYEKNHHQNAHTCHKRGKTEKKKKKNTMGSPFTRVPFARATRPKILNVNMFNLHDTDPFTRAERRLTHRIRGVFVVVVVWGGGGWEGFPAQPLAQISLIS